MDYPVNQCLVTFCHFYAVFKQSLPREFIVALPYILQVVGIAIFKQQEVVLLSELNYLIFLHMPVVAAVFHLDSLYLIAVEGKISGVTGVSYESKKAVARQVEFYYLRRAVIYLLSRNYQDSVVEVGLHHGLHFPGKPLSGVVGNGYAVQSFGFYSSDNPGNNVYGWLAKAYCFQAMGVEVQLQFPVGDGWGFGKEGFSHRLPGFYHPSFVDSHTSDSFLGAFALAQETTLAIAQVRYVRLPGDPIQTQDVQGTNINTNVAAVTETDIDVPYAHFISPFSTFTIPSF